MSVTNNSTDPNEPLHSASIVDNMTLPRTLADRHAPIDQMELDGNVSDGTTSHHDSAIDLDELRRRKPVTTTAPATLDNSVVSTPSHESMLRPTFLGRVAQHERVLAHMTLTSDDVPHTISITGDDLTLADVVAVAYRGAKVQITDAEHVHQRVDDSVAFLQSHIDAKRVVYGVNTGFGGSADTRSNNLLNTQRGLVQLLNSGVLLPPDVQQSEALASLSKHDLSRAAVRGSMLVRANCLLRGHSAVRLLVIETLVNLLNRDFIPVVPLRGSISASGDLSPLSYIAAALKGSPDIRVDCRLEDGSRSILPADQAMKLAGLAPVELGPKEGLGLLNGTAVSCAVGCLALHETQYLALAAQVLTGMCTEAMGGCADNYHPFIAKIRPHPGQIETGANITRQLQGSRLVADKSGTAGELYQDRYALRTATQWIGPYLEDLHLALDQLDIELNSTTDNPLIDPTTNTIHHGGNFQAVAVTAAVEKARLALQMFGKLIFAQCTELINPMLNNTLTPNLCFDDPSTSFTFKGVDINLAAYMAELAYLANPVSSHVQSAEMQNQAVNSMALVSARATLDAVEVLSLMVAAGLYAVCQALDLRALAMEYTAEILREARATFDARLAPSFATPEAAAQTWTTVEEAITTSIVDSKTQDTPERARSVADSTVVPLTRALLTQPHPDLTALTAWLTDIAAIVTTAIRTTRARFAADPTASSSRSDPAAATAGPTTLRYLSAGSAVMYRFIRHELRVPLHRGLVEEPSFAALEHDGIRLASADEKKMVGSRIGVIYAALREGRLGGVWVACLEGGEAKA